MSAGPILALRAALLAHLEADATLASLMGGTVRLHDEAPRAAAGVYATFGDAKAQDRSGDAAPGHAHMLDLVVWSKPGSARAGLDAAERIAALCADAPLGLDGHRLVWLAVAAIEAGRDPRGQMGRTIVRLSAMTEPA